METSLSGSFGLNQKQNKISLENYVGALVYINSIRELGYVLYQIDKLFDTDKNRFCVWTSQEKFGTFISDITPLQFVSSSTII